MVFLGQVFNFHRKIVEVGPNQAIHRLCNTLCFSTFHSFKNLFSSSHNDVRIYIQAPLVYPGLHTFRLGSFLSANQRLATVERFHVFVTSRTLCLCGLGLFGPCFLAKKSCVVLSKESLQVSIKWSSLWPLCRFFSNQWWATIPTCTGKMCFFSFSPCLHQTLVVRTWRTFF